MSLAVLTNAALEETHHKNTEKRGIHDLGYGYENYGLPYGGYNRNHHLGDFHDYGHYGAYPLSHEKTVVITKSFPVAAPYPVAVEKPVPVPYKVPVAVPFERPVPFAVDSPYPVHVPRPVPVAVNRPVPVPYKVPVKVPYLVPRPVHYPKPYPVAVHLKNYHQYDNYDYGLGGYY